MVNGNVEKPWSYQVMVERKGISEIWQASSNYKLVYWTEMLKNPDLIRLRLKKNELVRNHNQHQTVELYSESECWQAMILLVYSWRK